MAENSLHLPLWVNFEVLGKGSDIAMPLLKDEAKYHIGCQGRKLLLTYRVVSTGQNTVSLCRGHFQSDPDHKKKDGKPKDTPENFPWSISRTCQVKGHSWSFLHIQWEGTIKGNAETLYAHGQESSGDCKSGPSSSHRRRLASLRLTEQCQWVYPDNENGCVIQGHPQRWDVIPRMSGGGKLYAHPSKCLHHWRCSFFPSWQARYPQELTLVWPQGSSNYRHMMRTDVVRLIGLMNHWLVWISRQQGKFGTSRVLSCWT